MSEPRLILNIGAGKLYSREIESANGQDCVIYLDRSYDGVTILEAEERVFDWLKGKTCNPIFVPADIFEFLDTFKFRFDSIIAYRIFEHMEYCSGEIGRLLEACNMLTNENATLDIIVPNALLLCNMLREYENLGSDDFAELKKMELIINSEFCNIKADPHASVWTPTLARMYILSEGTWDIHNIFNPFPFENRDIYMRILCFKGTKEDEWLPLDKIPPVFKDTFTEEKEG